MSPLEFYTKEQRKANGVFYTPNFLSDYLAKKVIHYRNKKPITSIIDPACGDGALLRGIAKLVKKNSKNSSKVYGIDKDINALISSTNTFSKKPFTGFDTRFVHADGLFPFNGKKSKNDWKRLRKDLHCENGFDIILSNPPWGAELNSYPTKKLKDNFNLAKGQFDVFDLFMELILANLSKDGIYGVILPDSVFSQEQMGLRKLLAEKTTIHLIARLGEKIFPEINRACVIIIGCLTKPHKENKVDCFRLTTSLKKDIILNKSSFIEAEKQLIHYVPQSRFLENENYNFDIDLKTIDQKTFDKIQINSRPLKDFVTNTRGAEISKKGIVCKCNECGFWMPYPKSNKPKCPKCYSLMFLDKVEKDKIIVNHNGYSNVKLKTGEDLFRFTSNSKSWINTVKEGINYKDLSIYNGDKILVRKTGIGITASIDYDNSITTQVVYILKLRPEYENILTLEFILAILNSRALTYFLIKKFGENEWRTHPYLTQTILINLPFPKIDLTSEIVVKFIESITEIIRSEVRDSKEKNISKAADILIEKLVAGLFNLNESDYDAILETLRTSEQLIPIKRLLNCNVNEIFTEDGI